MTKNMGALYTIYLVPAAPLFHQPIDFFPKMCNNNLKGSKEENFIIIFEIILTF